MFAMESDDSYRRSCFTCIWTIENASSLLLMDGESPTFIVNSMDKTNWMLDTNNLDRNPENPTIELGIRRQKDNGPVSIEIEFELSVLAANGLPIVMQTSTKRFRDNSFYLLSPLPGNDEVFFQRRAEFLPDDTLTVRCRMWRPGTEISKPDICFCRTRLGVDRRSFVWAIREFSSLQAEQKRTHLLNPTSNRSPKFVLSLFLSERSGKSYINIQIDQNSAVSDHYMLTKFSLLDSVGRVVHSMENDHYFDMYQTNIDTLHEFYEKDKLVRDESLLVNDVLSLRCEFRISAESVWSRIENYRYLNVEDMESMTEKPEVFVGEPDESFAACCPFKKAFEDLYWDESLSDVYLQAGGMSFPAHKNVLSSRSAVFEAMFTQDMREKTSMVVDIPDLNADTLDRLLLYIYKDTIQELQWECAMDLFRAADKYQLVNLRKKCSLLLKSKLSVTNVSSILSLADLYEDGDLRTAAEVYILKHDSEVFASDTWENFKMENLQHALEVTERIISLRKKRTPTDRL